MPLEEESWEPEARHLGFASEEAMLRGLYLDQSLSINKMAKLLGYSTFGIRMRLQRLGVELRQRGGDHTEKNRRALIGLDDHELNHTDIQTLVDKYAVHPSTVSAERRRRRKMKKEMMEVQR